eukprot:TRINITY_DN6519_c0_g1_i1.p1 TRINITY_DN6519_c0_g1~~TRINITY_DN6519_c0_g1_i1.p1  ORF type:complete len:252 (-),score=44.12 TRINITY_DN6519_c0_g1_i1:792-1436(-)
MKPVGNATPKTRLEMIKGLLHLFVSSKRRMSPLHSFALCTLEDRARWILDPTTDANAFLDSVEALSSHGHFATCDVVSVLEEVMEHVPPPALPEPGSAPEFVVRVLLLYARSHIVPLVPSSENGERHNLLSTPTFFLDVLYLHERGPTTETADVTPQMVFDRITSLDLDTTSYFFENSIFSKRLQYNWAQLLAHPLQRHPQDQQEASLDPPATK